MSKHTCWKITQETVEEREVIFKITSPDGREIGRGEYYLMPIADVLEFFEIEGEDAESLLKAIGKYVEVWTEWIEVRRSGVGIGSALLKEGNKLSRRTGHPRFTLDSTYDEWVKKCLDEWEVTILWQKDNSFFLYKP